MNYYERIQKAIDFLEDNLENEIRRKRRRKKRICRFSNFYRLFFCYYGISGKGIPDYAQNVPCGL